MKTIRIILLCTFITVAASAATMITGSLSRSYGSIDMPGTFLSARDMISPAPVAPADKDRHAESSIVPYQVMGITLVIWLGLSVYLFLIDRKVTRLEKNIPEKREKKS